MSNILLLFPVVLLYAFWNCQLTDQPFECKKTSTPCHDRQTQQEGRSNITTMLSSQVPGIQMPERAKVMWKIKQLVPQLGDQLRLQKAAISAFQPSQDSLYLSSYRYRKTMKGQEDLICMFVYQPVFIYVRVVFAACLSEELSTLM